MKIIGITLVLAVLSLGVFSQYSFASSDDDNELFDEDTRNHILCTANDSEKVVVELLLDRKAGFEDGKGPHFNDDAISVIEHEQNRDMPDFEKDLMLISAQKCIDYLLE